MAQAVIMPKAGMSMETGTILRWLKAPGDHVRRGESLLEIETDKVSMEVEAETDGILLAITRSAGEVVAVTQVIGYIGAPGESVPAASTPDAAAAPTVGSRGIGVPVSAAKPSSVASTDLPSRVAVRATPLARAVARQRGVDVASLRGTGPGGAVRMRDLPAEGSGLPGRDRRPMTPVRRAIAARMMRSHGEIPAVTIHADGDVTELDQLRHERSLTPFFLKAAAAGCREHPLLRSALDGDAIVTHRDVDLGIAVAREGGLIVPVLRGADALSVAALTEKARELSLKAREGRLTPAEVSGAVFTVTNLGMYGVRTFDPLIDPPQGAILGIGAVRDHLSLVDGKVAVRKLVDLALTFDHRIMDGAEAALALKCIRDFLESPLRMLL